MLSNIFIYSIVAYGICNIIIFGNGPFHLIKKFHEYLKPKHPILNEMFSCFICLPTTMGFLFSAMNLLLLPTIAFTPMNMLVADKAMWPVIVFLDGMFTSGICWLIHTLQEMMERVDNNEE